MKSTSIHKRRLAIAGTTLTAGLSGWLLLATVATAGQIPLLPGDSDPSPAAQVMDHQETAAVEFDADARAATTAAEPTKIPSEIPVLPPLPDPFHPSGNEVLADAKRIGAGVVHLLTNYSPDSSTADLVAGVTIDPARTDALITAAEDVHHPGLWSRGTIQYAQLGGHLDGKISIMVVVRQELGTEGTDGYDRAETRTMDVRLVETRSGRWAFDELSSAGGQPVARPDDLSPLAAKVVDDPRIDLPDSAIWDIYSGHTDDALLQVMADIAERTPYAAAVLHTGHPDNVFGTARLSNHTVGRAIDIYELDSTRVIDSHDTTSLTYQLVVELAERLDIKELGSPWRFEDTVVHTFTNQVHHDHLHIGVYPDGWVVEVEEEAIPPQP